MSSKSGHSFPGGFLLILLSGLPGFADPSEAKVEVKVIPEIAAVGEALVAQVTIKNGGKDDLLILRAHASNLLIHVTLLRPNGEPEEPTSHNDYSSDIDPLKPESYRVLKAQESFTYEVQLSEREAVRPTVSGDYVVEARVPVSARGDRRVPVARKTLPVVRLTDQNVKKACALPLAGLWWTTEGAVARIEKVAIAARAFLFYTLVMDTTGQQWVRRLCEIPRGSDFVAVGSAARITIAYASEDSKIRLVWFDPGREKGIFQAILPDDLPATAQDKPLKKP